MAKDPNYDRYAGMESLPGDPLNPRKPRPFRVDEDGKVIYMDKKRDVGSPTRDELARAGILDWDELDRRAERRLAQLTAQGADPLVPGRLPGSATRAALAPARRTIDGIAYDVLSATTFDPALSNGVTAIPSIDLMRAAIADKRKVAVRNGPDEKGGFLRREPGLVDYDIGVAEDGSLEAKLRDEPGWATVNDLAIGGEGIYVNRSGPGTYVTVPKLNAKTGSTRTANTFSFGPRSEWPSGTEGLSHGHIDGTSDGMVDDYDPLHKPRPIYGDIGSLDGDDPIPIATVSKGQVGWHQLENGRLQFMYPAGKQSRDQVRRLQENLNRQQLLFHRRG